MAAQGIVAPTPVGCDDGGAVVAVGPWEHPNEDKLAEMILYVAGRIMEDRPGGATKLNKILYYSEFVNVRTYGAPITGSPYQKLEEGPAPLRLRPIRDCLCDQGAAMMRKDRYYARRMDRLVPLREANTSVFSPAELQSIDRVIDALWGKSARQVSDMSHKEAGWKIFGMQEIIPLSTAYLPQEQPPLTDKTRARLKELIQNRHP